MSKKGGTVQLDEETWGELEKVAMSKGISKSDLMNQYVSKGLSHEVELTSIERYSYSRKVINLKLDNILLLFGTTQSGSIVEKFEVAFISSSSKNRTDTVTAVKNLSEISLFEVLTDIKKWDLDIFEKCSKIMGHFGRTRQHYLSLYQK